MPRKSNEELAREKRRQKILRLAAEAGLSYDPYRPVSFEFSTQQQTLSLINDVRALSLTKFRIELTQSEVLESALYALYDTMGTQDELAETILHRAMLHKKVVAERKKEQADEGTGSEEATANQ